MLRHELKVYADYHQFYVWDAGVDPQAPEDFTDEDTRRMVKVAPNVVVIQPVRNMEVPVELEVHETDPGCESSDWDHVVETGIELLTGKLQIHECTGGPALDLQLSPGSYRVRTLFSGLGTLSADGLEGDDRYRIVLWPGPVVPLHVTKQWEPAPAD